MHPLTVKKRCCDERPRCRTCPFVWNRLAACGWADQVGRRRFVAARPIPADVLRVARKGRARPLPRP